MELGDDLVQRRCWLKPPQSSSSSDGRCSSSFSKATGTSAESACVVSANDQFDNNNDFERPNRPEKRKYFVDARSPDFQYALEYLDQDVEEVHAKLRKDWFCMDSECNR